MRISDWSSDVCSSDLVLNAVHEGGVGAVLQQAPHQVGQQILMAADRRIDAARQVHLVRPDDLLVERLAHAVQALELEVLPIVGCLEDPGDRVRSEEHTSELQSLMRISYAVFCF